MKKKRKQKTNQQEILARTAADPWPQIRAELDVESLLITLREAGLNQHANVLSLGLCSYSDPEIATSLGIHESRVRAIRKSAIDVAHLLLLRNFSHKQAGHAFPDPPL